MRSIPPRAAIAALCFLATWPLHAQQRTSKPTPRQVVFVCEHGTVKSLVAIEHFNKLARARGLAIEAVSRGTRPDSVVPMVVRQGLAADGFDVSRFTPRPLLAGDLTSALLVVALDADVEPLVRGRIPVARWDSLPSVMASYDAGRSAIVSRVQRLVDSLASSPRKRR